MKKIYIIPGVNIVRIESEMVIATSQINVDPSTPTNQNLVKSDDWDIWGEAGLED